MIKQLLALALAAMLLSGCSAPKSSEQVASTGDQVFATAYKEHQSGLQVSGTGTVTRILSDDNDGERHQRFILALASDQTLLVTHNIDIAPRIPSLQEGDSVEFSGVYEWNDEGGLVHWTHHDPQGQHQAGWLKHNGTLYQ